MARMRFSRTILVILVLLLSFGVPISTAAQTATERQRQVVYNGQIFDGQGYQGQFYPWNEETIYVIADMQNVFIPKVTDVYWWPISREYKADWESHDETLNGTLEIGEFSFPMTVYSLVYDGGYASETTSLVVGEEAVQQYNEYLRTRDNYQLALKQYYDQQELFNQEIEDWGKEIDRRTAEGLSTEDLPVPKQPQAPTPITRIVTEPQQGINFNVPAGEYQMQLRDTNGNSVPGSERTVVSFDHRREGVAYQVIAESKWTLPDISTDPNDIIFISGENVLYIQPSVEREYDAFYSAKLVDPQQKSIQDRRGVWSWLPTGSFTEETLSLNLAGGTSQLLTNDTYYAKQLPGAALGYEIVLYDESVGEGVSTFDAFKIQPSSSIMKVFAPDVSGSSREIRVVSAGMGSTLLILAFIPLICGIIWRFILRWRTR